MGRLFDNSLVMALLAALLAIFFILLFLGFGGFEFFIGDDETAARVVVEAERAPT